MKISAAFPPVPATPEHIALAETLGYSTAWVYDTPALQLDCWMTLALAATRTRRIRLGPGVMIPSGVALAGEVADGVILTRSTLDTAATVRQQLDDAACQVGRDPNAIEITTLLPTAVADTREAALATLRPGVALYAGFFPRYNRLMAEHGFVLEAAEIAAAWARGDREAAEHAVSDAMIEATSIVGTPEQCRARIDAYRGSGVDTPILSPFARGGDAKARFEAVILACAPAGR